MLYNQNNLNVAKIASKNDTRPELSSVFFTDTKTVATDAFRLLEMSVPSDLKPEDYPSVGNKTAMRGCKPFMIPAKELSKMKITKNKELPIMENVAISFVDDKMVELMTTDLETANNKMFKRVDGTFPDYERIFPTVEPVAEVQVNGKWLAELLEITAKLDKADKVTLKFYANDKPLVIEASNNNQKGRAMLMPLRG